MRTTIRWRKYVFLSLLLLAGFLTPLQAAEEKGSIRVYLQPGDDVRTVTERLIQELEKHPCDKFIAEKVFREKKMPFVLHLKIDRTSRFFWGKYYIEVWSDECGKSAK